MREETVLSPASFPAGYPVFAVECDGLIANRFALVHAAAARARELNRGAQPRISAPWTKTPQIALGELAAGAFDPAEIEHLLGLDRPAGEAQAIEIDVPEEGRADEQKLLEAMSRDAEEAARRRERLDSLA